MRRRQKVRGKLRGYRERSSDHSSVHEIAKTFSKSSASENEITERFSDREVIEVLLEGFAWVLELGLSGRRKALRSVIPLRGSGKNTQGASERVATELGSSEPVRGGLLEMMLAGSTCGGKEATGVFGQMKLLGCRLTTSGASLTVRQG